MGGFAQGSQQDVGGTGQPAGPQVVLLALLEGGHHICLDLVIKALSSNCNCCVGVLMKIVTYHFLKQWGI